MPLGPGRQRLGRARWARVGGGRSWAVARIWLPSERGLRCLRPIVGGWPDLAAVGAGKDRPAVVCARPKVGRPADQRFRPLGGVSRLEKAASLDHPNVCRDPWPCRRRERQLTGRSGTESGWRWTRPLGHRPGVSQRMITTSGPFTLWRNTKWPQALIIRRGSVGVGPAAVVLVSGRFHPALRRQVAAGRAPGAARAGCPASGSARRSAG